MDGSGAGTAGARERRILLVTMPLADPVLPNLAIEQLAALARQAGEACDVLYGTLRLPRTVPYYMIHGMCGPAIFVPAYFGLEEEVVADEVARALVGDPVDEEGSREFESVATDFLIGMDAAATSLGRCLEEIPPGRYDLVGFSVGFDAQKLPSAALARLLKARDPGVRILFGGTGCDGDMGTAVLERFPEVDAVLRGEADTTFLAAVRALRGEAAPTSVPNFVHRDGDRIVTTHVAEPVAAAVLDELPLPDYRSYYEQRAASPHGKGDLVLFFESSRGCWWGQSHHCRFCGIRAVSMGYRRRSAQATLAQVEALYSGYRPDLLYATDAILDLEYLKSVLPVWAGERHTRGAELTFFYEIKSNMRREHVALLAAAGVLQVQPGIESFSTRVLKLMDKGATGLQQVELLKWAQAYGIKLVYGLLVGTPGETIQDYEETIALMRSLHHLPPPVQVNRLALHRFSPYAADPERYGFRDLRPDPLQRIIYRAPDDLVLRLCYECRYTLDDHERPEMVEGRRCLAEALAEWHRAYRMEERLVMSVAGDAIVLFRRSGWTDVESLRLDGAEAEIYRRAQHINSIQRIAREIGEEVETVSATVQRLADHGLMAVMDGKCLALAVPLDADPWKDSGLDAVADVEAPQPWSGSLPILTSISAH